MHQTATICTETDVTPMWPADALKWWRACQAVAMHFERILAEVMGYTGSDARASLTSDVHSTSNV